MTNDFKGIIDSSETSTIMEILENLEDEVLAVQLLKEFNERTSELGLLITNQNDELDTTTWKNLCDDAKSGVDKIIKEIKQLK